MILQPPVVLLVWPFKKLSLIFAEAYSRLLALPCFISAIIWSIIALRSLSRFISRSKCSILSAVIFFDVCAGAFTPAG